MSAQSKKYINPTPGYSNAVAIDNGTQRTIYIAGQVGTGDSMEEQFRTSILAVLDQLNAANASFEDVVKMTIYIVDYQESYLDIISRVRKEVFGTGKMPAITMLGVNALALKSMKVETEAVAVIIVDNCDK